MTPMKCKTCGKSEWRHVCGGLHHVARPADTLALAPKPDPAPAPPKPVTPSTDAAFDKKAYQREYMKQRRARQKDTAP